MTATRPPRVRVVKRAKKWWTQCPCCDPDAIWWVTYSGAQSWANNHAQAVHPRRRPSVALCPHCTDPAPPGLDCPCQQPAYAVHRCPQCDEPDPGPCARCERENAAQDADEISYWRNR